MTEHPVETYLRLAEKRKSVRQFHDRLQIEAERDNYLDLGAETVKVPRIIENDSEKTLAFLNNFLNRLFRFVLITEYFSESLVLMRRKFCWDFQDILHQKLKVGQYNWHPDEDWFERHRRLMVRFSQLQISK